MVLTIGYFINVGNNLCGCISGRLVIIGLFLAND